MIDTDTAILVLLSYAGLVGSPENILMVKQLFELSEES